MPKIRLSRILIAALLTSGCGAADELPQQPIPEAARKRWSAGRASGQLPTAFCSIGPRALRRLAGAGTAAFSTQSWLA